jgi:general secretion pathway protein D
MTVRPLIPWLVAASSILVPAWLRPKHPRRPERRLARPPRRAAPGESATPPAEQLPGASPPPPTSMEAIQKGGGGAVSAKPAGFQVKFNLQDADLSELVNHISGMTGKRFIYGPKVRQIKAIGGFPERSASPRLRGRSCRS